MIEGIIPIFLYLIIHKLFYFYYTLESVLISYSCILYYIIIFHRDRWTPHPKMSDFMTDISLHLYIIHISMLFSRWPF